MFVVKKNTKRILLCSGKIYYGLAAYQKLNDRKDVAIVRLEQLYPFPQKQIEQILKKYPGPEIIWVQEEPENMGAWSFILRMFGGKVERTISRRSSASPATGYQKVHKAEQEEIIFKSFKL